MRNPCFFPVSREFLGEWFAPDCAHRHSVCEPSLRGLGPWGKGPISGPFLAKNNRHAAHKSPPDLACPADFGAYSPGPDGRVVVCDAHIETLARLHRPSMPISDLPILLKAGTENTVAPQRCAASASLDARRVAPPHRVKTTDGADPSDAQVRDTARERSPPARSES